ncbi:MAG: hypothetical protein SV186_06085 [Candidatus Nanohaloarchaea archaeon]|nr:hypothetical protein [Candidatus Nanohaloarchaea archaeon]
MGYQSGIHKLRQRLGLTESDEKGELFYAKVLTLLALSLAAVLYLLVEGALAAGAQIEGIFLTLVVAGFIVETLPDIWMYVGPLKTEHPLARRLIRIHYGIEAVSYIFLLIAVLDGPLGQFISYSLFMLLWLTSFVVGEATTLVLD